MKTEKRHILVKMTVVIDGIPHSQGVVVSEHKSPKIGYVKGLLKSMSKALLRTLLIHKIAGYSKENGTLDPDFEHSDLYDEEEIRLDFTRCQCELCKKKGDL